MGSKRVVASESTQLKVHDLPTQTDAFSHLTSKRYRVRERSYITPHFKEGEKV